MCASGGELFAARHQPLERVFADGFQHDKTRFRIDSFNPLNQVLVHERRETLEEIDAKITPGIANRLRRLQRSAASEKGETAKQGLLRLREQLVTPINGVAKRLLPFRKVQSTPGEQSQTALQSLKNGAGRQQLRSRGR